MRFSFLKFVGMRVLQQPDHAYYTHILAHSKPVSPETQMTHTYQHLSQTKTVLNAQ